MKPTEYMIGDWVKRTDPKTNESYYAKVSGICPVIGSNHKQTGWAVRFHKEDEPFDHPCPVLCDPVFITQEILEANGFEAHGWADSKLFTRGFENDDLICKFFIEYRLDNQCLFVDEGLVPTPVRYVHQLQHAMRLCGLNKEADNFVIKKGGQQ